MGKTFVEDERPCDSCVNVTRYGCASWNCEYINRDEAIKAWREKHETADHKTENSSEKPNNCEDLQDWKDRMWAEAIVTEPTISKMEQVDKDINVRSKDEPQADYVLSKDSDAYKFNKRMEVEEAWLNEQSGKE